MTTAMPMEEEVLDISGAAQVVSMVLCRDSVAYLHLDFKEFTKKEQKAK